MTALKTAAEFLAMLVFLAACLSPCYCRGAGHAAPSNLGPEEEGG